MKNEKDHRVDHRADHKTDHNRGFRSGRTWKTPFLFSVILCFILSACGNSGGGSDGNVGESSTAVTAEAGTEQKPGSGANGNTGVATEATTEEKITPLKLSDKIVCLDEKKKMYDLFALLPDPGEYDLLQDYLLEDTEHVLLLYLNMAEKEGDPGHFLWQADFSIRMKVDPSWYLQQRMPRIWRPPSITRQPIPCMRS